MQNEIIISNSTDLLHVSANDIMGVSAEGNYSHIILNDGDKQMVSFQLGMIEDMITEQLGDKAPIFVRVGRSIIVNIDYVFTINITKQDLTLRAGNGRKFQLSASKDALGKLKTVIEILKKGGNK